MNETVDGLPQPTSESPGGGARTGDALTGAQVRQAMRHLRTDVSSHRFVAKLALCATLTAAGLAMSAQPGVAWRVVGTILLGCMFAHAAELQHEALHNLGFQSPWANTVAGTVLGIPMLISFTAYRVTHLRHHKYLGTPLNREFFDYGDQYGASQARPGLGTARFWLVRFSMVAHYRQFIRDVARAVRRRDHPGETPNTSRRIRRNHLIILVALVAVGAVSLLAQRDFLLWQWLLPLLLVAGPVHAAIELPEHFRCETSNADPFANTRTIRSNRLMVWLTNGNNFHVEHHLMPNLPIDRLGDLHQEVRGRLRYFHPGYLHFVRSLVRRTDDV